MWGFQVLEDPVSRPVVGLVHHILDRDDLQLLPLRVFGKMQGSCQKEADGKNREPAFLILLARKRQSYSDVNLESDG